MAERETTTRFTNLKLKPGYYRNGKLISGKNTTSQWIPDDGYKSGDVIVKSGFGKKYLVFEYKGPKHKGNAPALGDGGFQRTEIPSKGWINAKLVPPALRGNASATQQTGYTTSYGHGGQNKRWNQVGKDVKVTLGSSGFSSGPPPKVSAEIENIIKTLWPDSAKGTQGNPDKNRAIFSQVAADSKGLKVSKELLAAAEKEAIRRFNVVAGHRSRLGGAKGIFLKDGSGRVQYVPPKYTPEMDHPDYQGVYISAFYKNKDGDAVTAETLKELKANNPEAWDISTLVNPVEPNKVNNLTIPKNNNKPTDDLAINNSTKTNTNGSSSEVTPPVPENKPLKTDTHNDYPDNNGSDPLNPTAASLQADLRALNTLNKQNLRGLQGSRVMLSIMRKEQELSKIKGDTHPSLTGRDHHGVGYSTNTEARDWLRINKL